MLARGEHTGVPAVDGDPPVGRVVVDVVIEQLDGRTPTCGGAVAPTTICWGAEPALTGER